MSNRLTEEAYKIYLDNDEDPIKLSIIQFEAYYLTGNDYINRFYVYANYNLKKNNKK